MLSDALKKKGPEVKNYAIKGLKMYTRFAFEVTKIQRRFRSETAGKTEALNSKRGGRQIPFKLDTLPICRPERMSGESVSDYLS